VYDSLLHMSLPQAGDTWSHSSFRNSV